MARTMEVLWTGADGSEWDLTDYRSTANLVSLDGLGMPTFDQQFAASGARDGRRYEGTNWQFGTISMTIAVGDVDPLPGTRRRRTGEKWRDLDRAWRKSVSPETPGKLTIVTASTRRHLDLRLNQPIIIPPQEDPALLGLATYTHVLTADDVPWWQGEELPAEFQRGPAPRPFFSGGTDAHLYISSSNRLGKAEITNIGDREAYPIWFARGPFTSAIIGIGDQLVRLPFPRGKDQFVYVNSANETIVDENGNSLWPLMGFADPTFAAVGPNQTVKLTTTIEGGNADSAIGVGIRPLYEGPW